MTSNMHYFKKVISLISILFLSLTSCDNDTITKQNQVKAKDSNIEIGILFDELLVERWESDKTFFVSAAEKLGASVTVDNAYGSSSTQLQQLEQLIQTDIDVIAIVPVESNVLINAVDDAKKKGIIIISYDRLLTNCNSDLYISFDNKDIGTQMGKSIEEISNENTKVIMICGPASDNNVSLVVKGFEDYLTENNIDILVKHYLAKWNKELASEYIENNLDTVKKSTIIMCGNDNLASSVINTLTKEHLSNKIKVLGQDGDLSACQRIVEGTQFMTVYKPVKDLARQTAYIAVNLAKGNDLSSITPTFETINDGTYDVPFVKLNVTAVTKENIDEVLISTGVHTREEIYINVKTN